MVSYWKGHNCSVLYPQDPCDLSQSIQEIMWMLMDKRTTQCCPGGCEHSFLVRNREILSIKTHNLTALDILTPENLFTIRPMGVVSKKLMGARRILFNSCLWRRFDAWAKPWMLQKLAMSTNIPRNGNSAVSTMHRDPWSLVPRTQWQFFAWVQAKHIDQTDYIKNGYRSHQTYLALIPELHRRQLSCPSERLDSWCHCRF